MEIIQQYFNEAVAEIEKSGNPKAREAAAQYALIMIGQKMCAGVNVTAGDAEYHAPLTFDDYAALVEDELADAYKYLQFYKQTGDEAYMYLIKQELSHAQFFIEKDKPFAKDPGQQAKVKAWVARHDEIMRELPK